MKLYKILWFEEQLIKFAIFTEGVYNMECDEDMYVIKRDGSKHVFDISKIKKALDKANKSLKLLNQEKESEENINLVLEYILSSIHDMYNSGKYEINVEDIHSLVEEALQNKNCYALAKEYILYRSERDKERFKKTEIAKTIEKKLFGKNNEANNANLDENSFSGRKSEAESVLSKKMALDYYISPKFSKNHINNRVYIHDLDSYCVGNHNCLSIPFDDLLASGVKVKNTFLRPAQSVSTAMQLVAVLMQLQSLQQFGGVASTHLDWTMVPYVRKSFAKHFKDGLKYAENKSDRKIEKILNKIQE